MKIAAILTVLVLVLSLSVAYAEPTEEARPVRGGISINYLYGKFLDWSADLSDDERRALFHDTAVRVYRLDDDFMARL